MAQLNVKAPSLPIPSNEYEQQYFDKLTNVLRLYFNQLDNPGPLGATSLNFDLTYLPTEASLSTLRLGDVYRDTQDGVQATSQMLRIKTS